MREQGRAVAGGAVAGGAGIPVSRGRPTKGSMVLGAASLAVVWPLSQPMRAKRARCTAPVEGTVIARVPTANDRQLEAQARFTLDGQSYTAHLTELNKKRSATPPAGGAIALRVDPATKEAVVASPWRAWFVPGGLLVIGLLMVVLGAWGCCSRGFRRREGGKGGAGAGRLPFLGRTQT